MNSSCQLIQKNTRLAKYFYNTKLFTFIASLFEWNKKMKRSIIVQLISAEKFVNFYPVAVY